MTHIRGYKMDATTCRLNITKGTSLESRNIVVKSSSKNMVEVVVLFIRIIVLLYSDLTSRLSNLLGVLMHIVLLVHGWYDLSCACLCLCDTLL